MLNAAKTGHTKIVTSLLDWGVDINAQVFFENESQQFDILFDLNHSRNSLQSYEIARFFSISPHRTQLMDGPR